MINISESLSSRIFHDLASPLGAISSGIELLEMSGQITPEHTLMAESAEAALARLRFFRWAFGPSSDVLIQASDSQSVFDVVAPKISISGLETMKERQLKLLCLCIGACVDQNLGTTDILIECAGETALITLPDGFDPDQEPDGSIFLGQLSDLIKLGAATMSSENGAPTLTMA